MFLLIPEFLDDTNFLCSPFVEYKGAIPSKDLEKKRAALESEINRLVTLGGQVFSTLGPSLTGLQLSRLVCMTHILLL